MPFHYTSSYVDCIYRFIAFTQNLRFSRICSQAEYFRNRTTEMKFRFYKKGYPKNLSGKEMRKINFSGFTRRNKRGKKDVLFVIKYHPSYANVVWIVNQSLHILFTNKKVSKAFTLAALISFLSVRKLCAYLHYFHTTSDIVNIV